MSASGPLRSTATRNSSPLGAMPLRLAATHAIAVPCGSSSVPPFFTLIWPPHEPTPWSAMPSSCPAPVSHDGIGAPTAPFHWSALALARWNTVSPSGSTNATSGIAARKRATRIACSSPCLPNTTYTKLAAADAHGATDEMSMPIGVSAATRFASSSANCADASEPSSGTK
jgi:hypothetical protein